MKAWRTTKHSTKKLPHGWNRQTDGSISCWMRSKKWRLGSRPSTHFVWILTVTFMWPAPMQSYFPGNWPRYWQGVMSRSGSILWILRSTCCLPPPMKKSRSCRNRSSLQISYGLVVCRESIRWNGTKIESCSIYRTFTVLSCWRTWWCGIRSETLPCWSGSSSTSWIILGTHFRPKPSPPFWKVRGENSAQKPSTTILTFWRVRSWSTKSHALISKENGCWKRRKNIIFPT